MLDRSRGGNHRPRHKIRKHRDRFPRTAMRKIQDIVTAPFDPLDGGEGAAAGAGLRRFGQHIVQAVAHDRLGGAGEVGHDRHEAPGGRVEVFFFNVDDILVQVQRPPLARRPQKTFGALVGLMDGLLKRSLDNVPVQRIQHFGDRDQLGRPRRQSARREFVRQHSQHGGRGDPHRWPVRLHALHQSADRVQQVKIPEFQLAAPHRFV